MGRQPGQSRYNGHVSGLQITEAVYATTIPILIGTKRLHGKLLDYYGFNAQQQSAPTGKGIFGSKGDYWEYYATVVIALAQGPCIALVNVWTYNGQLENLSSTYNYTVPGGGGSITPVSANAAPIQVDLGVTKPVAYSVATNDYGGSAKTLSGTQNVGLVKVASSPGAGEYSFNPSTGTYTFGSAEGGNTVTISYSSMFSLYYFIQTQFDLVPDSTPWQITPDNHDYFYEDLGVTFIDDNTAGVLVSGTPTASGEYQVMIGYYDFYPGDAGRPVAIKYSFTSSDPDVSSSSVLNLTLFNGAQGQSPWSYTESANPSHAFGYTGVCYVASENLDLGQTAQMPPYNYEVVGQCIAPGQQDCNVCDVNALLLADPLCGISFPATAFDILRTGFVGTSGYTTAANLPTTTSGSGTGMRLGITASAGVITGWVIVAYGSGYQTGDQIFPTQGGSSGDAYFIAGTWLQARAHWNANGYFISDCLESAGGIADVLGKYHEAGNTAAFFSAGYLKLVPYSEVSAVGNGSTYTPPTTPVATLTWDDILLPSGQKPGASLSDDFITNDRKASVDLYNYVQANYSQRINSYNNNLINEQSDANIALVGERRESAQDWTFICLDAAAQWALNCRLGRGIYVDKTFKFSLPYTFDYLEPMDTLVTPTGISVRITKIEEDENQILAVEAENFLYGASSASIYPVQSPSRYQPVQNAADPGSTVPAFFQTTQQQNGGLGNQISIAASGDNANWGGCQIWLSVDGTTYSQIGAIKEICAIGILQTALPATPDPDTTDTLSVHMGPSGLGLVSASLAVTNAFGTLCALISPDQSTVEFISYETATLTGALTYDLTYLRRGVYGTPVSAFVAGSSFVFVGSYNIFSYTYQLQYLFQPTYMKFPSVNLTGAFVQPLAQCKAYEVIPGLTGALVNELYVPSAVSVLTATGNAAITNATLAYDKNFATGASCTTGAGVTGSIQAVYSGFGTGILSTPAMLFISYSGALEVAGSPSANIVYVNWNFGAGNMGSINFGDTSASGTAALNVPAGTDLSVITVTITAANQNSGAAGTAQINEIWIQP